MTTQITVAGLKRQVLFWAITLVLFIVFLMIFSSVLLPFIAGMALAYFLDPVADRLERLGLSRTVATVVILISFVVVFILSLMIVIPLLAGQASDFFSKLPGYISPAPAARHQFQSRSAALLDPRPAGYGEGEFLQRAQRRRRLLGTVFKQLWSSGMALVNIVSLLVVTPVVAFYMLLDWTA